MKKIVSVILAVFLATAVLSPSVLAADDVLTYYVGDDIVVTINQTEKTLTVSGTGALPDYSTAASAPWYKSQYAVTVIINDGITAVGNRCFSNNTYTKSVTLADSVERIGDYAFNGCKALKNVAFPSSLKEIGASAFESCTALASVSVPEGLERLDATAFLSTSFYNSLPSGINLLGGFTLQYKGTVTEEVVIPDGTKAVSSNTLIDSAKVTRLIIPDSVEKVFSSAFYNDTALKHVEIPDSVAEIGDFAFGYSRNSTYYTPEPIKNFTVYGHGGTAAEKYAKDCGFAFECYCEENGYTYYPDCLEGGEATVCCIYCGKLLRTEMIEPKNSHSFGEELTVEPDCETDGKTYVKCADCGYEIVRSSIPASGHSPVYSAPLVIEPTCKDKGMICYFCSVCKKVCGDVLYIAPKGHVPSDFVTVSEPDCTSGGVMISSCSVCNEVLGKKTIPPLGHVPGEDFEVLIKADISSGKQGFRVKRCERCGVAIEHGYFTAGDVNGDGRIGSPDLAAMKRFFADNPVPGSIYESCDVNGDGRVNSKDLAALKRYLAS